MKMGSKICMNQVCRATTSIEWKKGWGLKSGAYATLCNNCGSAYENLMFCYTFHLKDTGWRECTLCGKRIHCGCVASKCLHEYNDFGGICCITCVKLSEGQTTGPAQFHDEHVGDGTTNDLGKVLTQLAQVLEEKDIKNATPKQLKQEPTMVQVGEVNPSVPSIIKEVGSSSYTRPDQNKPQDGVKNMHEFPAQPTLKFSLSTPLGNSNIKSFPNGSEGPEHNRGSPSQQGKKTLPVLHKPLKPTNNGSSEAMKAPSPPQARVARPPADGRGRHQLLPRYWPRITDQELQQISGHLNSTIVPLFEKILSASDAGRIGRLVLPKACAETYFPHINNSDGLPIRVQDITGKEWTFQFRFWPNNNSRMYVLEGVTPCIQNMQLEAGDTVTFSRIEPGGKLVIGARKATNNDAQEIQMNMLPNGASSGEEFTFAGASDNLAANGARTSNESIQKLLISEKKTMRNIGSKNKRLLIHSEDAMELKVSWEEAQDLLRPSPTARPNIILIEDLEIEEYDDPPVFGKRTIFTSRPSGVEEQWVQCDSCSKWRVLPVDILIPAKWSCSDNIWDSKRCSCSAGEDINVHQLDAMQRVNKDSKRRKITSENKLPVECEPSGLDALATAAVLGDNMNEMGDASPGTTTKHPRHRPGCSCIVCIQPPSGKGKHPPSCKCNVCLTVRRRFKTLMQRKKKRQSDREAELAHEKDQESTRNASETDATVGEALLQMHHPENNGTPDGKQMDEAETEASKASLDLNSHPTREDELLAAAAGMSLTNLVNATSLPLEMYLKQSGLGSLGPCLPSQVSGIGGYVSEATHANMDREKKGEEV
ncbi:hypothetical protein LIER_10517 [Lithospermum erythrorhizon]|uniref:B3 domain-containing transcription repressor VAL1 n=1 Tax=Lithospermum erythrorhizon TaxID=34254 RepID=A0AAV3PJQ9_LITER